MCTSELQPLGKSFNDAHKEGAQAVLHTMYGRLHK